MIKDKKIGENEKAIFYENMFTKDFGDGFRIVMVEEKKNGRKTYLLLENEEMIYESQQIEGVLYHRDFILLSRKNHDQDQ
jgi:hypothetical protein